ncbi:hypothetical protein [Ruficoccus sp. ZRK36]|uniref:hypothetical protein n=1 Tax=Ruficoccus sp. ZRK36 TaxID=2866311 RepID=UPI001C7359A9|nr:hypothetical protein [Ruficoccus sp. ZRK36]QYY35582.1 hypothetical protein K0V07_14945 [Ruficoccus sp. ZRK36]
MNVPYLNRLTLAAGALALVTAPLHATTYSVSLNSSYFGWLDQYSLDTFDLPGNEACVPTSSTNAMTYLQNAYSGYYGTTLTGTTYSSWEATAEVLMGSDYMDTTNSGTAYERVPYALNKYIVSDYGFTQTLFSGMYLSSDYWDPPTWSNPGYITDSAPTSSFFLNSLGDGAATLFSILYPSSEGGGGHYLLASGLVWDDSNNDGIIQFSENAALSFVDPLDPAYYSSGEPSSGPKMTSGHLYYDTEGGVLKMRYDQYYGDLPYDHTKYDEQTDLIIDTVFSINVVPEPQTWAAWVGLAALGLCLWRRRQA